MSDTDKATEPNMDDILASIRKLIADEPPALRAGQDARAVNRLIEPLGPSPFLNTDPASNREQRLPPPVDRLSDALRGMPSRSARTPGFDDDLADLLDDAPAPAAEPEAPVASSILVAADVAPASQPEAAPVGLPAAGATPEALSISAGTPARETTAPKSERLPIDPWSALRSLSSEPVAPMVNGLEVSAPAPASAHNADVAKAAADLRVSGEPHLESDAAPENDVAITSSATTDAIAQALAAASARSSAVDEGSEPPIVLIPIDTPAAIEPATSFTPTVSSSPAPAPVAALPPQAPMFPRLPQDDSASGLVHAAADQPVAVKMPSPVVPLTPAEASIHAAAVSALMAKAFTDPAPGLPSASAVGANAFLLSARFPFAPASSLDRTQSVAMLEPVSPPAGVLEPAVPGHADPGATAALESQAAAASALGALAAGLAASSLGGSKAPEPEAQVAATEQPKRTIEDIVTDMVRPMLEKWISENMPRIVEKALRGEAKSKKL